MSKDSADAATAMETEPGDQGFGVRRAERKRLKNRIKTATELFPAPDKILQNDISERCHMYTIKDLYDLDHTLAKEYLSQFTYPWEALKER